MPKAFLLKYKKRCEYFGRRSDEIGSYETSAEAIDLKTKQTDSGENVVIKGKKTISYGKIKI